MVRSVLNLLKVTFDIVVLETKFFPFMKEWWWSAIWKRIAIWRQQEVRLLDSDWSEAAVYLHERGAAGRSSLNCLPKEA